jgi:hypothetical protein
VSDSKVMSEPQMYRLQESIMDGMLITRCEVHPYSGALTLYHGRKTLRVIDPHGVIAYDAS